MTERREIHPLTMIFIPILVSVVATALVSVAGYQFWINDEIKSLTHGFKTLTSQHQEYKVEHRQEVKTLLESVKGQQVIQQGLLVQLGKRSIWMDGVDKDIGRLEFKMSDRYTSNDALRDQKLLLEKIANLNSLSKSIDRRLQKIEDRP